MSSIPSNLPENTLFPPDGFVPIPTTDNVYGLTGPFYVARDDGKFVIGIHVDIKYKGRINGLYGSMLSVIATSALMYATTQSVHPALKVFPTSVSVKVEPFANIGEWVEARVESIQFDSRESFSTSTFGHTDKEIGGVSTSTCTFWSSGELIGHASATFHILDANGA
ncbi:hypothetical protein [Rhodoferax sp.]|uniref:hypothetical protein n=1 Tax=Rhodoferax sp. TaxID=50421 RepID=UPI002603501C|nr:hypothetical protein [Rhodoferax sp.]MDD2919629.1 hypothetical protein [Rhodoferax sp.]